MRRSIALLLTGLVAVTLGTSSTAAADADASKLSTAMAGLVAQGGYGDFPIDLWVPAHRAGDVYYLADVGSVDDGVVRQLEGAGATVRFRYPSIGWVALASSLDAVAAVSRLDRVARLELDRLHTVLQVTASPVAGVSNQARRGTSDVGADVLWAEGITGKGVTVGVADSGIDSTHPDLDDQDWVKWGTPGAPAKITSFVDCTTVLPTAGGDCRPSPGYDDNGHGTHVSGIATGTAEGGFPGQSGKLPGMAPEAALTGAKVCLAAGSCLNSSVMAGLQYLAAEKADGGGGADVINVSLGSGRFYGSPLFGAEQVTNADPEAQLVNALAAEHNVLFTISAGNSGPVIQSVGSPGMASQALGVAAGIADWDLDHPTPETEHGVYGNIRPDAAAAGASAVAGFSSRGPSGDRLIKPDVVAPGSFYVAAEAALGEVKGADTAAQNRYSIDPYYAVLSGTSMSAPAAAGASALVWDGYQRYAGSAPTYYQVKAALANTATTRAWEGSITGLTSSIRVKLTGEDPNKLRPLRNADWVGVTGEGAGRIHAPSALLALTQGIVVYTPQEGELDDVHELQPSWSLDTVARGHTALQTFVARGGPGLRRGTSLSFSVEAEDEPAGILSAPRSWFRLPKTVRAQAGGDVLFAARVAVPTSAAPGMYAATITAKARIGRATQNIRIPVQLYVDLVDADPAEGAGAAVEGPIWASADTDYSLVGSLDPSGLVGDIFTDWITYPVRLTEATERVDLSVYDTEGNDHMDLFVFDANGQEIDSTVTPFLDHATPGAVLYEPTSEDSPNTMSILDGDDRTDVTLPTTVWVAVSNSGPDEPPEFATYHLDVDVVGGSAGGGTTPPERIHSGAHAWWSGSVGGASSHLTQPLDLTGVAASAQPKLRFWAWYQLEDGFDWAYALVSTDGGASWTSLVTTAANGSGTTTLDPIGDSGGTLGGSKAYPNGLTGTSGHAPLTTANVLAPTYTEHTADLSPYAGRAIQLRFLYTSDPATNYENFYLDDLSVVGAAGTPLAVGATNPDDMETTGGWSAAGTPGFAWVTADTAG